MNHLSSPSIGRILLFSCFTLVAALSSASADQVDFDAQPIVVEAQTDAGDAFRCQMSFEVRVWSFFFTSGKGEGEIRCKDGTVMGVTIKLRAGGLSFGRRSFAAATARFKGMGSIDDLLGKYYGSGASAAAIDAAGAAAFRKGDIYVVLYGTGKGHGVSRAFHGTMTLEKKEADAD